MEAIQTENKIEFLNPDQLHKNPAFSQAVIVSGTGKTIYVGGQNAVDKDGNIIGKGDIVAQAGQVLKNLEIALSAAGASFQNVIQWNLFVLNGQALEGAYKVFQQGMGALKNPPLITMAFVSALANPDYLMEMSCIAVIPEE